MILISKERTLGWQEAIRGMRNSFNSWDKSDSFYCRQPNCVECNYSCVAGSINSYMRGFIIGPNDYELMIKLATGGPSEAKFRRMITVYMDILAPFYWWKEFDTYKVGTVANSCSTMHTITDKEFELDDFSHDHLISAGLNSLKHTIDDLNSCRNGYLNAELTGNDPEVKKEIWWQMIQLLPMSYNQKRTVMLNYEVLSHIYHDRKNHKLDEWKSFCKQIERLPYSKIITCGKEKS